MPVSPAGGAASFLRFSLITCAAPLQSCLKLGFRPSGVPPHPFTGECSFSFFSFFAFGPHPAVLRGHSWWCSGDPRSARGRTRGQSGASRHPLRWGVALLVRLCAGCLRVTCLPEASRVPASTPCPPVAPLCVFVGGAVGIALCLLPPSRGAWFQVTEGVTESRIGHPRPWRSL